MDIIQFDKTDLTVKLLYISLVIFDLAMEKG